MNRSLRIICLGNADAGDDAAALRAVDAFASVETVEVIRAGRPGPDLLDLLDRAFAVVLVDVVCSGARPGTIHRLPLARLPDAVIARSGVSSHGFGPGEALRLGRALGRPVPDGELVGIEGLRFDVGDPLSPAVRAALPRLVATLRDAVARARGVQRPV